MVKAAATTCGYLRSRIVAAGTHRRDHRAEALPRGSNLGQFGAPTVSPARGAGGDTVGAFIC